MTTERSIDLRTSSETWYAAVGRVHFKIFKTYKHGEYFGCAIELGEFIGIKNNEPEYNHAKWNYVIKNYNEAEDNIIDIMRNIITTKLTIRNRCGCNRYWHCAYCRLKTCLQGEKDRGIEQSLESIKYRLQAKYVSQDLIKEVFG